MNVSTESVFQNRRYLAVSADIVSLPKLDTQATGFSLGEAKATVPKPVMYKIAPYKDCAA